MTPKQEKYLRFLASSKLATPDYWDGVTQDLNVRNEADLFELSVTDSSKLIGLLVKL